MTHAHRFEMKYDTTVMSDVFSYTVSFGLTGKLFDYLILRS